MNVASLMHVYEVRPRRDERGVDLISDVLPFVYGDNQFLLEIESLDQPLLLTFIHAGGWWFFTGLSGYVV